MKARHSFHGEWHPELVICSQKNDARALRVAELMNDYRTLQIHISEQTMNLPRGPTEQEGHRVLVESRIAAQTLLENNYGLEAIPSWGGDEEAQVTAQLRK